MYLPPPPLNVRPFLFFLFSLSIINIILFIHRAYYFKDFSMLNGLTPNPFYLLSRACGKLILILVLVLIPSLDELVGPYLQELLDPTSGA